MAGEGMAAFSPKRLEARMGAVTGTGLNRIAELPLRSKVALAWLLVLVVIALLGPLVTPYPPDKVAAGPLQAPPSFQHPFGTDDYGRDVLSRVMVGTRVSAIAGVSAPLAALLIGGLIGTVAAVAALSRRWGDEVLMRAMDVQMAFPGVVLAVVFATVIGPGLLTTVILLSIVYTPIVARFMRGNVIAQMRLDYVAAERTLGSTTTRIITKHVWINVATPTVVFLTLVAADAIVLESGLSYLGAGVRPPAPSWGNMIRDGQQQLLAGAWWMTVFPGLAILSAVLALNTLAESVSDRIAGRYHLLGGRGAPAARSVSSS